MLFAIRDDDTSFHTAPEVLERIYGDIWEVVPISLSVIPFSVSSYRSVRVGNDSDGVPRSLADNHALVEALRRWVRQGRVEIMLHGYTHEYRDFGNGWVPECAWKTAERLDEELREGQKFLEQLLETKVSVFVPPSNNVGNAINALGSNGLNLSGIVGHRPYRPVSSSRIRAYARRWFHRLWSGRPYPRVNDHGSHRELVAHALTPTSSIARLQQNLHHCAGLNAPFVVATHYWEIERHPELRGALKSLVSEAARLKAQFVPVGECFTDSK